MVHSASIEGKLIFMRCEESKESFVIPAKPTLSETQSMIRSALELEPERKMSLYVKTFVDGQESDFKITADSWRIIISDKQYHILDPPQRSFRVRLEPLQSTVSTRTLVPSVLAGESARMTGRPKRCLSSDDEDLRRAPGGSTRPRIDVPSSTQHRRGRQESDSSPLSSPGSSVKKPTTHLADVKPSLGAIQLQRGGESSNSIESIGPALRWPERYASDPTMVTVAIEYNDEMTYIRVKDTTKFSRIFSKITSQYGVDAKDIGFASESEGRVGPYATVADLAEPRNRRDKDYTLNLHGYATQKGGKPVIYLFPPKTIDVKVRLSLHPEWTFSALYPVSSIIESENKKDWTETTWHVRAEQDGTLREKKGGLAVAYLFWEAHTGARSADHRLQHSGIAAGSIEPFYPATPNLGPEHPDAILLPIADVPVYLDNALKVLGLHTEARTSFITYWLPDMLKYRYIAFRFLPQQAYEYAAPLEITPIPDIVNRIFLLFKGVAPDGLDLWKLAIERTKIYSADVHYWKGIVGGVAQEDNARWQDPTLFRVLEWGGMEVKV